MKHIFLFIVGLICLYIINTTALFFPITGLVNLFVVGYGVWKLTE